MLDGWDHYCSRAAGARLLRAAATLYEIAGINGQESTRQTHETTVHKLKELAFTVGDESDFRDTLRDVMRMHAEDIDAAVCQVKTRAMAMRGHAAIFPETSA